MVISCCFHFLFGWSHLQSWEVIIPTLVFVCIKSECGSNMDAKNKLYCILWHRAFNGYNLKHHITDYT